MAVPKRRQLQYARQEAAHQLEAQGHRVCRLAVTAAARRFRTACVRTAAITTGEEIVPPRSE